MGKRKHREALSGECPALTPRQREILELLQAGRSNKEVARTLDISEGTVKQHLVGIYRHLKVSNRTQAAQMMERARDVSLFTPSREGIPTPPPHPAHPPSNFSASLQPISLVLIRLPSGQELVNRVGSEGFGRLQRAVRQGCEQAAEKYNGLVQGVPGGVLLLFGIPRIREDDPQRAACAGEMIWRQLLQERKNLPGEASDLRICVMSGEVVTFAEDGRTTVHGDLLSPSCPWSDAPCQEREGGVCISPTTRQAMARLHERYGVLNTLPTGVIAPRAMTEKTPPEPTLVGRQMELLNLHERLRRCEAGQGAAMTILAEAGFGKSYLVQTFRQANSGNNGPAWMTSACQSYLTRIPFHPVPQWLSQLAGATGNPETWQHEVRQWLHDLPGELPRQGQQVLAYLDGEQTLPPPREAADVVDTVARFLVDLPRVTGTPMVLFLDNLQWADPYTRLLFLRLAKTVIGSPVWLLGAGRRAELRFLTTHPEVEVLSLRRLVQKDCLQLLKEITRKMPRERMLQIAQWCGGVPLFVVETARAMRESNLPFPETPEQETTLLPKALLGLVLERLDSAGVDWRLVRALAAAGRITWSRLQGLHGDIGTTQTALDHLIRLGLLQEKGFGAQREFVFANPLVRSAVWHTLPMGDRNP